MRILTFCFLALLPYCLQAQSFIRYGFKEGLESEIVVDITQDENGYLWIATLGGGISQFDGERFINYTVRKGLSHNFVMNVACFKDSVYAMTDNGISIYSKAKGFKNISSHQIKSSAMSTGGSLFFRNPDGALGSYRRGILKLTTITHHGEAERVAFVKSEGSDILILTDSHKLFKTTDSENLAFVHDFNKQKSYEDGTRIISIGMGLDYIPKILIIQSAFTRKLIADPTKIRQVVDVGPTKQWVIHSKKLLLMEGSSLTDFSKDENFTTGEVNVIFKDYEQNIWVGTNDGLYKFEPLEFQSSIELPEESVFRGSTPYKNGILTSSTSGDMFEIHNKVVTTSSFQKLTKGLAIISILYDSLTSTLWIGTNNSGLLSIKQNGNEVNEYPLLPGKEIRLIRQFKNQIFVGTDKGLLVLESNGSFKLYDSSNGLYDNTIWGIIQDADLNYLILTRKGLNTLTSTGQIIKDTTYSDVFAKRITCFEIDGEKNLWVGTVGYGLIYIERKNKIARVITTDEGLNSDVITNLMWDGKTSLVVGTNRGLDIINIENPFNSGVPTVRRLTKHILSTNFNSFRLDRYGHTLWLGGGSKFIPISLEQKSNRVIPIINFTNIVATKSGGRIAVDNINPTDTARSFLKFNENNIDFEFKAVNLSDPKSITYSYRMLGWDSSWTYTGLAQKASFTNLPPGSYSFQAQAHNQHLQTHSTILSKPFIIHKPFWFTGWFIVASSISMVAFIGLLYKIRIRSKLKSIALAEQRKQLEVEKVRKEIARDFHDSMGNKLAGIKLYSNLALMKASLMTQEVNDILTYIEKNSQELFEGTKDFIWSIDPESDNLIEVYTYVKDFGEEFFKRSTISFYSQLDTSGLNPKLLSGQSRHIVMIFKEAMTNTVKHANSSIVKLNLELTDDHYRFTYMDDGNGISTLNLHGKGIKNMKQRAASIMGRLEIAKLDKGTQIELIGNYCKP